MQKSSPLSAPLLCLYGDARYTLYDIYPLFCYLKDRAKVIQTFEFTKKRKPEEEDLHLKAYLIFPVW